MAKFTQCVICNCRYADQVNDMLKNKVPYTTICKFLADKGIKLSDQSVSRHKRNHLTKTHKPRQVQSKKIAATQQRARGRLNKERNNPNKALQDDHRLLYNTTQPIYARASDNRESRNTQIQYLKQLELLKEDIDVVNEMLYVLAVSKDRVERALVEEADAGLIMATTGSAIKDYGSQLKVFQEMTAGMESLTKLRFAQLVQMIGNVFVQQPLTDANRHAMLMLLEGETKNKDMPVVVVK